MSVSVLNAVARVVNLSTYLDCTVEEPIWLHIRSTLIDKTMLSHLSSILWRNPMNYPGPPILGFVCSCLLFPPPFRDLCAVGPLWFSQVRYI